MDIRDFRGIDRVAKIESSVITTEEVVKDGKLLEIQTKTIPQAQLEKTIAELILKRDELNVKIAEKQELLNQLVK